jgi:hypothetical protein
MEGASPMGVEQVKMTVREVIERLEAAARGLPLGINSPVMVMLCDGTDVNGSRELEIDTLTWVTEGGDSYDSAAMIKGHPHIDEEEGRQSHFPGIVSDADTMLREWSGEAGDDAEGAS